MIQTIQEFFHVPDTNRTSGSVIRGSLACQVISPAPAHRGAQPCGRRTILRQRCEERGSAIVIALFLSVLLSLLGLAFVLTSVTDATISNSNRQGLNTYYVAEAGGEEGLNKIITAPRSQFNPMSYSSSFPVDVTRCFYNDSSAPDCPVTVGGGTAALVSVPVSVGAGKYSLKVQYLGRTPDAENMTLNKYLVFSTAQLNASKVGSSQTVSSQIYAESIEYAFPAHPITSCSEPTGSGPWRPKGYIPPIPPPVIDPTAPSTWPGTTDPNYGTTPLCGLPFADRVQQAIQTNADCSEPSCVSTITQFWKIAPTGTPPDPRTGEPYKVYINGDLTVNGNTTIYGIYYVTGNVTFNGSARLQGVIYAPNGTFTGNGGGDPNNPDATGGIFANGVSSTGNHYTVLYKSDYTNAYLGQVPYRVSRGGR